MPPGLVNKYCCINSPSGCEKHSIALLCYSKQQYITSVYSKLYHRENTTRTHYKESPWYMYFVVVVSNYYENNVRNEMTIFYASLKQDKK